MGRPSSTSEATWLPRSFGARPRALVELDDVGRARERRGTILVGGCGLWSSSLVVTGDATERDYRRVRGLVISRMCCGGAVGCRWVPLGAVRTCGPNVRGGDAARGRCVKCSDGVSSGETGALVEECRTLEWKTSTE